MHMFPLLSVTVAVLVTLSVTNGARVRNIACLSTIRMQLALHVLGCQDRDHACRGSSPNPVPTRRLTYTLL